MLPSMNRYLPAAALALAACLLTACNPTTPTATPATTDNPSVGISTHSVVVSGTGETPTTTPTTPAAAPAGPLLKATGTGIKNTKQFTTGDNWTLSYTYDCHNFGQAGNFMVSDENGMPLVNELKLKGSGSSPQYDAGTHHLQVNSECDWTITVTSG